MNVPQYFASSCLALAIFVNVQNGTIARANDAPAAQPTQTASVAPSRSRSHWDFVDGDEVPIQIRYAADVIDLSGGSVVVVASVNGKTGTFLIDTGAASTLLFDGFAAGLGLGEAKAGRLVGIAGNGIDSKIAVVKDLAIGKSVLHDSTVRIVSSGNNGRASFASGLDGILGYDIYEKALVEIDLSKSRLRVIDPARFMPTVEKNSHIFDIDISTYQPQIVGKVGSATVHPIFDTGNSLLMTVSQNVGNALGMSSVPSMQFEGVDGATVGMPCSRVNRVQLGSINYDGPIVCFDPRNVMGKDGGIIGFDFLRHFDWMIDYPDKKFMLTPNGM